MPELRQRSTKQTTSTGSKTLVKSVKSSQRDDCDDSCKEENSLVGNILKIIFFIVTVPPMLNYASLRQERDHLIKNTTLFDVGFGQKLHMSCRGEGRPTVVLESPAGLTSDVWLRAQSELVEVTRVCVYDRAGLGWSDPAPVLNMSDPGEAAVGRTLGPEATVVRMSHDLHRLISLAHPQPRPLILVGAELGALVTRVYTQLHSQDVTHLVMIDPLSETVFDDVISVDGREESAWLEHWYHTTQSWRLLQLAAMTGLTRLALVTGLMNTGDQDNVRLKHHLCDPWHLQAVLDEHRSLNTSLGQVRELSSAWSLEESGVESTVISSSQYDHSLPAQVNRVWSRSVQELIERTGSRHLVISGADRHLILTDLVSEITAPILRIVKTWRQKNL